MQHFFLDSFDENGSLIESKPVSVPATVGRPSSGFDPDIEAPAECKSTSRKHATFEDRSGVIVLVDHSRFGTLVNQQLIENGSVPLHHGAEIIFGHPGDGWRVKFRSPVNPGMTTTPADRLELLLVTEVPRLVKIGPDVVDEQLGDRAFCLLKFLVDNKGNWYTTDYLVDFLWPDSEKAPLGANEQLARHKKSINDLLRPHLDGMDAIESYPYRGYRMRPREDE